MNQLPILLMIPAVFALWLAGAFGLVLLASVANLPGVNEHGTGAFIILVAAAVGIAGATIHAIVNLFRRKKNRGSVGRGTPLLNVALAGCGVGAIGLGAFILFMVAGSKYGDPTVLGISAVVATTMIVGGLILFYSGVRPFVANGAF